MRLLAKVVSTTLTFSGMLVPAVITAQLLTSNTLKPEKTPHESIENIDISIFEKVIEPIKAPKSSKSDKKQKFSNSESREKQLKIQHTNVSKSDEPNKSFPQQNVQDLDEPQFENQLEDSLGKNDVPSIFEEERTDSVDTEEDSDNSEVQAQILNEEEFKDQDIGSHDVESEIKEEDKASEEDTKEEIIEDSKNSPEYSEDQQNTFVLKEFTQQISDSQEKLVDKKEDSNNGHEKSSVQPISSSPRVLKPEFEKFLKNSISNIFQNNYFQK